SSDEDPGQTLLPVPQQPVYRRIGNFALAAKMRQEAQARRRAVDANRSVESENQDLDKAEKASATSNDKGLGVGAKPHRLMGRQQEPLDQPNHKNHTRPVVVDLEAEHGEPRVAVGVASATNGTLQRTSAGTREKSPSRSPVDKTLDAFATRFNEGMVAQNGRMNSVTGELVK
ncbi:hypothetical protein LTR28_010147, partial [Elasticomyces elasticus]